MSFDPLLKKVAKAKGASSDNKNNKIIRCHIASILTASDVSCTHTHTIKVNTVENIIVDNSGV